MLSIIYANVRKACEIDFNQRKVEIVHKKCKVTVTFHCDDRVEVVRFNPDSSIMDKQYLELRI